MSGVVTPDGTEIYYNDWGAGPPVVFSHGWPLTPKTDANPAGLPIAAFDKLRASVLGARSTATLDSNRRAACGRSSL